MEQYPIEAFQPSPRDFSAQYDQNETQDDIHGGIDTSTTILVVVIPIFVVFVIVVVVFFVVLLCYRIKSKRSSSNSSCNSSFRSSLDKRHLSVYSFGSNANSLLYSPDIRSCIYGGRLGCSSQPRGRGAQVFTYRELEMATEGFNKNNIIDSGRFRVLYRGTLRDGTVADIKLLHKEGKQRERDFRIEVDLLSRLNSVYLVSLIGYCADQHHRILVFEHMQNGSLQQHLHPPPEKQNQKTLDWPTRVRIALDGARGLEFLHEHTVPAVIHRDFKCRNIMLDHNFRAKVSDFGMAKISSDKINGQVLTRVLGTTGYVAPEYASTGKLTTKSDVYSYGVVLLELITGRVPIDITRPSGQHVLVSWALPRLTNREKVIEMVDPALQGQFSKKELIQIAAIAAVCVQSEADYRPLMTDVVQSLIPMVKYPVAPSPSTPSRFRHQIAISVS